jgi:hypothetical protein
MVLGVRCSNRDFRYAVVDGRKTAPTVVRLETLLLPQGFASSQALHWLFQEVTDLLGGHTIGKIVIKRFEGQSRGKPFEERVGLEAAVMLAAGAKGMKGVFKKGKSTLAKDLGQKGRARYLTNVDTSVLPQFVAFTEKQQEAVLAVWSELP